MILLLVKAIVCSIGVLLSYLLWRFSWRNPGSYPMWFLSQVTILVLAGLLLHSV